MSGAGAKKLELRNISMRYTRRDHRFDALRDVSLEVEGGEFISLVGA
jgi:ABC-type dipeptide/oligopeptide/nickel transport system ATPase subunit